MKTKKTIDRKAGAGTRVSKKRTETQIIKDLVKDIRLYAKTLSQNDRERFKGKLIKFLNTLAKEAERL
ncbi:MAG TPA: hypothetical protein PKM65_17250 [Spirochaetota bacterium]|nr:hypothetical protein [Spirochaetota bacterium]HNT12216.1 hypothetical protein [Spirochaetota bacterium]HNV48193.1 hypothetical protein [Spirochaetota bacterium]HOS41644.1 hypothetical protein [Spirochaetota bacterium]HPI23559.1 hypothetical protein [Spirochaetota bacterium]